MTEDDFVVMLNQNEATRKFVPLIYVKATDIWKTNQGIKAEGDPPTTTTKADMKRVCDKRCFPMMNLWREYVEAHCREAFRDTPQRPRPAKRQLVSSSSSSSSKNKKLKSDEAVKMITATTDILLPHWKNSYNALMRTASDVVYEMNQIVRLVAYCHIQSYPSVGLDSILPSHLNRNNSARRIHIPDAGIKDTIKTQKGQMNPRLRRLYSAFNSVHLQALFYKYYGANTQRASTEHPTPATPTAEPPMSPMSIDSLSATTTLGTMGVSLLNVLEGNHLLPGEGFEACTLTRLSQGLSHMILPTLDIMATNIKVMHDDDRVHYALTKTITILLRSYLAPKREKRYHDRITSRSPKNDKKPSSPLDSMRKGIRQTKLQLFRHSKRLRRAVQKKHSDKEAYDNSELLY